MDPGKQGCYCITLTKYYFNAVNEARRKKTMEDIILIFTYDGGIAIFHHSHVYLKDKIIFFMNELFPKEFQPLHCSRQLEMYPAHYWTNAPCMQRYHINNYSDYGWETLWDILFSF